MSVFHGIVLAVLGGTVLMAFWRIYRGPHLPDRVLGIDFLSSVAIGIIAVYAIANNDPVLLDIALSVALLSFLGSVALGFFIERFR